MKRLLGLIIFVCGTIGVSAQDSVSVAEKGTIVHGDTVVKEKKRNFLLRFIDKFSDLDTNYVEPNHYNWALMMQNTNSCEWFTVRSGDNKLPMVSDPAVKLGPFFGYRWIFFGYTFQVNDCGKKKTNRTETELRFYGSMMGCDLLYRYTGEDFKWRTNVLGMPQGEYSGGASITTIGANVYYVFNHRRFSLPSLFSQSTVQKRSSGSVILGASITSHEFNLHIEDWPKEAEEAMRGEDKSHDYSFMDYAISVGYGYNFVLRKNLMLGVCLTPAIGYKHIYGNPTNSNAGNKINFDVIGRAALVWNNNKYFAGLSLVVHNYNFANDEIRISDTFGTLNLFVGLNFFKRKEYRNKSEEGHSILRKIFVD
ncbi:MAG: DUF4421 domain-containing protein [Bacteroidaceae bacterium]|nr:DUF4421 domain-containing protein [Bacteroidaceae bacterium]